METKVLTVIENLVLNVIIQKLLYFKDVVLVGEEDWEELQEDAVVLFWVV